MATQGSHCNAWTHHLKYQKISHRSIGVSHFCLHHHDLFLALTWFYVVETDVPLFVCEPAFLFLEFDIAFGVLPVSLSRVPLCMDSLLLLLQFLLTTCYSIQSSHHTVYVICSILTIYHCMKKWDVIGFVICAFDMFYHRYMVTFYIVILRIFSLSDIWFCSQFRGINWFPDLTTSDWWGFVLPWSLINCTASTPPSIPLNSGFPDSRRSSLGVMSSTTFGAPSVT